jgi:hypothetical protein
LMGRAASWNVSFGKHRGGRMCDVVLREVMNPREQIHLYIYVILPHVTW